MLHSQESVALIGLQQSLVDSQNLRGQTRGEKITKLRQCEYQPYIFLLLTEKKMQIHTQIQPGQEQLLYHFLKVRLETGIIMHKCNDFSRVIYVNFGCDLSVAKSWVL